MSFEQLTEFYLARHGETDWNRAGRFQGHTDIPLNALGFSQAQRLGARLADLGLAAVYSSDLGRARATAEPCAASNGLVVETDQRLRERNFGVFEGNTYTDIEHLYPEDYRRWREREPDFGISGGESLRQVSARISLLLDELALRHCGQRVLIVTHGGVLDVAYRFFHGLPLDTPRAWATPNAALNHIHVTAGRWRVQSWADSDHLAG